MRIQTWLAVGVCSLGLCAQAAFAADTRSQALGGERLLIDDRSTEVSLFNLGNPAGLAAGTQENFLGLELQTLNAAENFKQTENGATTGETKTTDSRLGVTPDPGLEHNFLFWFDPDNVLGVTAFYQGQGRKTAISQSPGAPDQDTQDSRFGVEGRYAIRLAKAILLGAALGYRSGQQTLADLSYQPVPTETFSFSQTKISYDLFRYSLGASVDLPIEGFGQLQAGVSFHSFDAAPFRGELTGLFTAQGEITKSLENLLLSGFEYDLAGGYHVKQQYRISGSTGGVTDAWDVTNEVTPQGSAVGLQGRLTFLENQTLGLGLELPFAELTTNKVAASSQVGAPVATLQKSGKSASIAGVRVLAQYFGQAKLDDPALQNLLWGARLEIGREDVKQYDYPNQSTAEVGNYQTYPLGAAVGIGVKPQAGTFYFGEFELSDAAVKVNQLSLSGVDFASPSTKQTITDSQVLRRQFVARVGGEMPMSETICLRGAYAWHRYENQYQIKDGSTLLGPNADRLNAGSGSNPYLTDHVISLGAGAKLPSLAADVYGAVHFPAYDPATDEDGASKIERTRSAWELGAAVKLLL